MRKLLPLLLLAFSVPALAHPGHGADSFQAGFFHPLTGLATVCHSRDDARWRCCRQSARRI